MLSCADITTHPGSKERGSRVYGDDNLSEKSHQLSRLVVQIVSQLQVVAEDKDYDVTYEKYAKHAKLIRIFACRNATLVGLMGILLQLKRTSDEYRDMKWARVHAIESGVIRGLPLPLPEDYCNRCTRYLEIKIINSLVRFVQKVVNGYGFEVAETLMLQNDLWNSDNLRVKVWDEVSNAALLSHDLFITSNYPFIETYTSNIGRDRPKFMQQFTVPRLVATMNTANDQAIDCSKSWDIDRVELQHQYPDIHWDRAT